MVGLMTAPSERSRLPFTGHAGRRQSASIRSLFPSVCRPPLLTRHDHIVRKSEAGDRIVAYILANPERKGLVEEASLYPWSGAPDPL